MGENKKKDKKEDDSVDQTNDTIDNTTDEIANGDVVALMETEKIDIK